MRLALSAFAAALCLLSAPTFAGQIVATSYSLLEGGVNAQISYTGSPSISNKRVGSGEISLTVHDVSSGPSSTLLVWCTDLFDALSTPATYDVGLLAMDHGTTG